ncbi:MAG: hypothetical protein LBM61_03470 [Prevotellaceae bacterium]|jgi:hypothetical protein|nr:hypothetical protein [Prevotellaceae bacterium]
MKQVLDLQKLIVVKEELTLLLSKPIASYEGAYAYEDFQMGCSSCTGGCTSCYGSCSGAMKG